VIILIVRGVSQSGCLEASHERKPPAAPTAVIAVAMHCMHIPKRSIPQSRGDWT
jgi:hypothetical protein